MMIAVSVMSIEYWFDSEPREIVRRQRGMFGRKEVRIPLEGATGIRVHFGRIRASKFWDVDLQFRDGRKVFLTRLHGTTYETAKSIAAIVGLPVVKS